MATNEGSGTAVVRVIATGAALIPAPAGGTATVHVLTGGNARTPTEDIRKPQLRIRPNQARMVLR